MKAMEVVLDLQRGGGSALFDKVVDKHLSMRITINEFKLFYESFAATMDNFIGAQEHRRKWDDMIKLAIKHMISKCMKVDPQQQESITDANEIRELSSGGKGVESKQFRKSK
jgi:hypothetical protein